MVGADVCCSNGGLNMYIICWVTEDTDHWVTTQDRAEAIRRYEKLKEMDDVYTVSICVPIVSTDYPVVEI